MGGLPVCPDADRWRDISTFPTQARDAGAERQSTELIKGLKRKVSSPNLPPHSPPFLYSHTFAHKHTSTHIHTHQHTSTHTSFTQERLSRLSLERESEYEVINKRIPRSGSGEDLIEEVR